MQRKSIILRYWVKIVNGNKPDFVKNSCDVLYNDTLEHVNWTNWAAQARYLLFHLGFGDLLFSSKCWWYWLIVIHSYATNKISIWPTVANLDESTRAWTYRALRPTTLHTKCTAIGHLQSLAHLITSSHCLRDKTGWWDRPQLPYESQKCLICHTDRGRISIAKMSNHSPVSDQPGIKLRTVILKIIMTC